MNLQILPLAITMMMGPQIISAIILATTRQAVRVSLAFLIGVAAATTVGVVITRSAFALLGNSISLGSPSESGSAGTLIQIGLIVLLLAAAVKNYVKRETVEPPKWLTTLMEAGPQKAFTTGLLVI